MTADAVTRLKRYHDALNHFAADVVAPMFAEDAVYRSVGIGTLHGRDAIIRAMAEYFAEYVDQVATDDSITEIEAGKVRSEWRITATSSRSGQEIARRGVEIVTFDADGLIVEVAVEDH